MEKGAGSILVWKNGLGLYKIHSPRVSSVEEMEEMINRAIRVLDPKRSGSTRIVD